jgi:uncharacterized protein YgiM (DUF1202 family)
MNIQECAYRTPEIFTIRVREPLYKKSAQFPEKTSDRCDRRYYRRVEMKRNFAIATVLIFCTILAVVPSSWAQSEENVDPNCRTWYRRVTTEGGGLNVRENTEPNARIRGTVPNGTVVLFNTGDRTGNWSEITAPGGLTGWVAERFLTYHHDGNRQFTGSMQVKTLEGGPVNLRSPGGEVIATVPNGTIVTVEDRSGYFANVLTPQGRRGQIVTQFLICN